MTSTMKSIVGAVNGDTEGMDIDADMDEVNKVEKNPDLEAEEDEADEEVSQQDEEAQPIECPGEGDCGS
jgi:outer membrane lipoprotein SlyB